MGSGFNSGYLQTNRGIIKIAEIVIGIILCGMTCSAAVHGHCFGEGRLGFASGITFVTLIINIVIFILNLLNLAVWKLERIYSIVCAILFIVAFSLIIWFLVIHGITYGTIVVTCVLLFFMFALYLWDVKILQGEASNH